MNLDISKILELSKDHSAVDACVHSPPGGLSVKVVNNGVVFRYPSRSVVYNAVDRGLAAAECTLWKWAWLAKNCARVKYRLKERELISLVNPLWLSLTGGLRQMNECELFPGLCVNGRCRDTQDGFECDCDPGFAPNSLGTNCTGNLSRDFLSQNRLSQDIFIQATYTKAPQKSK